MAEFRKQPETVRDYRERFEFKLTVGDNIICQRYFKINNFNPRSLKSFELADAIRGCAETINKDLKSKTQTYLEIFAPKVFNTVEEMNEYFKDGKHSSDMRLGNGIVVKNSSVDYVWGKNNAPIPCQFKFDDGELYAPITNENVVTYKFAFCVDGRETCTTCWEGLYPKYIRNSIDLSNKRGKQDPDDISRLSFEQYLDYKVVEGRSDLVWGLIKDICYVCSVQDNDWYTVSDMGYSNIPDYSMWFKKESK